MTKASMIRDIMYTVEIKHPEMTTNERYNFKRRLQAAKEIVVRRTWRETVLEEMQYAE